MKVFCVAGPLFIMEQPVCFAERPFGRHVKRTDSGTPHERTF